MSELIEPSENDLLRFEQSLNESHSLLRRNMAIVEVSAGPYRRKLLVSRYAVERCMSFDENKRKIGTKYLASTLIRACSDPDSYDVTPTIHPDEVELGETILYL